MPLLIPVTQAQKDFTSHVLFCLSDYGQGTGAWDVQVDFAVRSMKLGLTVHACVMKWLRANPVQMQRAYTEVQHEEGA
jgi:hypothetical protein